MTLPLFINEKNRVWIGWLVFLIGGTLYLVTNHFHFGEARPLPMTGIDQNVPFLPNTFWIYNSEYILFLMAYWLCHDILAANRFVYGFLGLLITSSIIFWIWPTVYPRDLYPFPDDLNALTRAAFTRLRETDTPANCCPSLHVSGVYLSALVYLNQNKLKFGIFFLWATLIAISTLTTKQHYLVDVVSGLGMAILFHILAANTVRG